MKNAHTFVLLLCYGYLASFSCKAATENQSAAPQINSSLQTKASSIYNENVNLREKYKKERENSLIISDSLVTEAEKIIASTCSFADANMQSIKKGSAAEASRQRLSAFKSKLTKSSKNKKPYDEFMKTAASKVAEIGKKQKTQWEEIKKVFDEEDNKSFMTRVRSGKENYTSDKASEEEKKVAEAYTKFIETIKQGLVTKELRVEEAGDINAYLSKFEKYTKDSKEEHSKQKESFKEMINFSLLREKIKAILSHININSTTGINTTGFAHSTLFTESALMKKALDMDEASLKKESSLYDIYTIISYMKAHITISDFSSNKILLKDSSPEEISSLVEKKFSALQEEIEDLKNSETIQKDKIPEGFFENFGLLKEYVVKVLDALNRTISETKLSSPVTENNTLLKELSNSQKTKLDMHIEEQLDTDIAKWFGFKEEEGSVIGYVAGTLFSGLKTIALSPVTIAKGVGKMAFNTEWMNVMGLKLESSETERKTNLAELEKVVKSIEKMTISLPSLLLSDPEKIKSLMKSAITVSNLVTSAAYSMKMHNLMKDQAVKEKAGKTFSSYVAECLDKIQMDQSECSILNPSKSKNLAGITQISFITSEKKAQTVINHLKELSKEFFKAAKGVIFLFSDEEKKVLEKSAEDMDTIKTEELKPARSLDLVMQTHKSIRLSIDGLVAEIESVSEIKTARQTLKMHKNLLAVSHAINLLHFYTSKDAKKFTEALEAYGASDVVKEIEELKKKEESVKAARSASVMCEHIIISLGEEIPSVLSAISGKTYAKAEVLSAGDSSDSTPVISTKKMGMSGGKGKFIIGFLVLVVIAAAVGAFFFVKKGKQSRLLE
ncbi:hypothetical protein NEAUS03_1493 [Nematocida ausubeli]|nr:hypothetical protein NEAUS03_1493 [Nematocida ausubeli]